MTVATEKTLLEKILGSKIGQEIIRMEKQGTLKKRREAVQAIKELNAQAESTIPKLRKEFDKELEMVKAAEKKLEAAKMKHGIAYQKLQAESHSFDVQIGKHEQSLRESYDPVIDKFLKEINSLIIHAREAGPELLKSEQVRDSNTLALRYEETFDTQGHKDTISKISGVYEQAEAMKLEAHDDLAAKLNELREALPNDCYTSGFSFTQRQLLN